MKTVQSTIEPDEFTLVKPYDGKGKMHLLYHINKKQVEDSEGNLIWEYLETSFVWTIPRTIQTFEDFCTHLDSPVSDPLDENITTVREQIKAYVCC